MREIKAGDYVFVHNVNGLCTGAGRVTSITGGMARYKKGPGLYGKRRVENLELHPLSDHWNSEKR